MSSNSGDNHPRVYQVRYFLPGGLRTDYPIKAKNIHMTVIPYTFTGGQGLLE